MRIRIRICICIYVYVYVYVCVYVFVYLPNKLYITYTSIYLEGQLYNIVPYFTWSSQ